MSFSPTPTQIGVLNGFGTAVSASMPGGATAAGSLIIAEFTSQLATGTSVSVTDNVGNVYFMITLTTPGVSQRHVEMWYCLEGIAGATSVSVNNTVSTNVAGTVTEWAGGAASVSTQNSLNNTSNASPAAATVVPPVGGLVIGAMGYQAGTASTRQETLTGAGGFTALTAVTRGTTTMHASAYAIATSTTAIGPTYTMSPAVGCGEVTAVFVPNAPAPAAITPFFNSNSGNSTSPQVVIPSSCAVGDQVWVAVTQNAADALTGVTGGLTPIDSSGPTTFPTKLYQFAVTASGALSAGTSFVATLSAIKAWSVQLLAVRGLNASSPLLQFQVAVGSTTLTTHAITTGITSSLFEIGAGKGNGTIVNTWTAPAGWTVRNNRSGFSGFSGSGFIASLDAGSVAAGTYGSDTYTPDQAIGASVSYILSLNGTTGNTAPVADAGPPQTVDVFDQVTLDFSASYDPDGTIATYTVTQLGGPAVTLAGSGPTRTFTPNPSFSDQTFTFSLTVTDAVGSTSPPDTVVITALGATDGYLPVGSTTWTPQLKLFL